MAALFYQMKQVGITGNVFGIIKYMHSCLKNEHYLSEPRVSTIGLKMDDSLSPNLFTMF